MQHLKTLPIWRDANRLLLAVEQAVRRFDAGHPWPARCAQPAVAQMRSRRICPRYHKYSLGSDLRRQAMDLCRLIHRAASVSEAQEVQEERVAERVLAVDDFKVSFGRQSGGWRTGRAESRPGLPPGHSWPLSQIKGIARSLRAAGHAYAFIAEEGDLPGGMKRRVLRYLFQPTAVSHPLNAMATAT